MHFIKSILRYFHELSISRKARKIEQECGGDLEAMEKVRLDIQTHADKEMEETTSMLLRQADTVTPLATYLKFLEDTLATKEKSAQNFTVPALKEAYAHENEFIKAQINRIKNRIEQMS